MILKEMILAEHSRKQCDAIIIWVGSSKKRFEQLLGCLSSDSSILSQRAAWPFSDVLINHPNWAVDHFDTLVELWISPDKHPAIRRNITRAFEFITIPEEQHGIVMHHCFSMLENPVEAVAVKAYCITILQKLSLLYPEIIPELKLILENLEHTPAIAARRKMALKKIKCKKSN